MSSEPENKLTAVSAMAGSEAAPAAPGSLVRTEGSESPDGAAGPETDHRLDRLKLQLDVLVRVRTFRVGDLLSLTRGGVVETVHEPAQDVPLHCGGVRLVWAEFEVVEQKLAVRITRLA